MENANHEIMKNASMETRKRAIHFDIVFTIANCVFSENRSDPSELKQKNHDFDTIFTRVNFKSGRFVRSFSMRCQEALDGMTTSGVKNRVTTTKSVSRRRQTAAE